MHGAAQGLGKTVVMSLEFRPEVAVASLGQNPSTAVSRVSRKSPRSAPGSSPAASCYRGLVPHALVGGL